MIAPKILAAIGYEQPTELPVDSLHRSLHRISKAYRHKPSLQNQKVITATLPDPNIFSSAPFLLQTPNQKFYYIRIVNPKSTTKATNL